jgi:hypothetical protein
MDQFTIDIYNAGRKMGLENYQIVKVVGIIKTIGEMQPKEQQFFLQAMKMFGELAKSNA